MTKKRKPNIPKIEIPMPAKTKIDDVLRLDPEARPAEGDAGTDRMGIAKSIAERMGRVMSGWIEEGQRRGAKNAEAGRWR